MTYVYFARHPSRGLIKIGLSANPARRMHTLGRKTALLLTIKGNRRTELRLHRKFRSQRVTGEWFRECEEIRAFIENSQNVRPRPSIVRANVHLGIEHRTALRKISRQTRVSVLALIRRAIETYLASVEKPRKKKPKAKQ